ncbi:ATP-binding cassette domain-containing protein [Lutibacter sp. TH_r2]|uniref:ABC transporter ATP-binding protein n=1 Tax=Lutibacter sp. TH_r2 TaxID=3082083 RepID=UPI002955D6CC|nr:ATP-binding cassette domain-containing protein [Lutibacter sp. TH_r2]MDV7186396.1 ATP-binding cassette domain-containing protein [Lutibacter sp. TH_r2]
MNFNISTHIAILSSEFTQLNFKNIFSENILNKMGLFTHFTLNAMIEEESKRDTSIIFQREGQSLRSMSNGERKISLLNYLLSLNFEYLYIENFYDNLDSENQKKLEKLVIEASNKTTIIQVVYKERELLPFIKSFYFLKKGELKCYSKPVSTFFEVNENVFSKFNIPKTTTNYTYNYSTFVKLDQVSISYLEKPILNNISWEIKLGEFWHLVGENGSGKTTLLSLITGDNPKAYGQNIVLFDKLKGTGENVWEVKKKIGYFTPNITELFNRRHATLHMILSGFYDSIGLYVKPLEVHIKLANEWLDLIQMSAFAKKTFASLSYVQQRMVLIARAMVKHPPLLILDEPTSGLNKENARLIVALINKIAKETKTTIIYVSHTVEKDLKPDKIYNLIKTNTGSTGNIL